MYNKYSTNRVKGMRLMFREWGRYEIIPNIGKCVECSDRIR